MNVPRPASGDTALLAVVPDEPEQTLASLLSTSQLAATPLGRCQLTWSRDVDDALQKLVVAPFEACVVDSGFGTLSLEFLRTARVRGFRRPLVYCSRSEDHALQANALAAGASDVIPNARLSAINLGRVIQAAIQRSRFEETLRLGEEMMRSLVESTRDDAIFMLDREGRILTWTQGAERLTGYMPLEVVGHHVSMLYPEADRTALRPAAILRHALSHGRHDEVGTRSRKDGSPYTARTVVTPMYGEDGSFRGFSAVTRDVEPGGPVDALPTMPGPPARRLAGNPPDVGAAHRAAENARRESLAHEVERIARMGSWGWDVAAGRGHWSPNMFRLLGLDPGAEVRVRTYLDAVHPDDRPAVQALVDRLGTDPAEFRHAHRIVRPDGTVAQMRVQGRVVADAQGRARLAGTLQDITPGT